MIEQQALLAFRWYLVIQLFGLAALPIALRLFHSLPDRGYGFSKPLGLLLAGWVFWLLTTLGWLRNSAGGILVSLGIVAGAGVVYSISRDRGLPAESLDWRAVLFSEVVFGLAFASWCIVRAHMPRIETAGGEKWMEIAFLRAILRSDTFPPHDPWLSGFAISYYYFGYVIIAMLTTLTVVLPSIAFNLGIATLFALTCGGAFSLVYNLLAIHWGGAKSAGAAALGGGILGPLLMAVMGNLEGLLECLHASGVGPASFWRWLDIKAISGPPPAFSGGLTAPDRFFWWWQASRVIHDYALGGFDQEVIDEFPGFSFLLGDMHPHVLAVPFVLLAFALALELYRRAIRGSAPLRLTLRGFSFVIPSLPLQAGEVALYALCLGGLGFLNTWDLPTCLLLVAGAYGVACLCVCRNTVRSAFGNGVFLFGVLFVLGVALYAPFWIGFQSQAGGLLPNLFNGSRLPQFLVMFGPLLYLAVGLVVEQARAHGVKGVSVLSLAMASVGGAFGVALGMGLILIGVGALPVANAWLRGEAVPGGEGLTIWTVFQHRLLLDPEMVSGAPLISPAWAVGLRAVAASPLWTAIGLAAILIAVVLTLRRASVGFEGLVRREWAGGVQPFVLLLVAIGALLTLGVEFVYLKDNFLTRMNTVFKFYFQAWLLWSVAGAYALATWLRRRRVALSVGALVLIAMGLVYPVLAIPQRAREYLGPGVQPTLDGAAYLADVQAGDYAAISWLNEHIQGAPVILEAPGEAYDYEGRVSAHTGLPTVLGWAGHEGQWRGSYDEQAVRRADIETLYTTEDPVLALTLLDKYDIRYVYIGPVERMRYPASGLAKFGRILRIVYDSGGVTVYGR